MIHKRKRLLALALGAVIFLTAFTAAGCGKDDVVPGQQLLQQQQETPNTVRVTFPEGRNVMQYGELLEANGVCSAQAFFDQMNTVDYSAEYDFLPSFDKLEGRVYKLEGYLFPDTYDFYLTESPDSVIKRFLGNFGARITPEMRASAASVGEFYGQDFSLDDIIILASIVEREINVPEETSGVAAVFLNRMKYPGGTVDGSATGGFFQSDATKFYPYVFDTVPDDFVSEYNTFNVKGLPKGPICCPSMSAITGSLSPDHDNGAFFFYTDVNKKVYYAVTLAEHQANWRYCRDNGLEPVW